MTATYTALIDAAERTGGFVPDEIRDQLAVIAETLDANAPNRPTPRRRPSQAS